MNRYSRSKFGFNGSVKGGTKIGTAWPQSNTAHETAPDPNDLIDTIVDAIDYAELARDSQGLIKASRLSNNDLRQAIDIYVQDEVTKELQKRRVSLPPAQESERYASHPG